MKKLLSAYGFNSDMQYFERIVSLYKNRDTKASKLMFSDLPQKHKKLFICSCLSTWESGLSNDILSKFVSIM